MTSAADSVVVRVPASTSNCGAGFDTLGIGLALYNTVTVTRGTAGPVIPVAAREADGRAQAMVAEAAARYFRAVERDPVGFTYRIDGEVPAARGLGSSVTVLAGVVAGLDRLHGTRLSKEMLVGLVAALEGHPDNASAGILGGFCVSRTNPATGGYVDTQRFAVPLGVAFVVASPPVELRTKESRGALPASLPFFDAVKSINAAAFLVAAFASGDFARLRHVSGDFIHEPYRLPRIPGGATAITAGIAAGAWTGWLSGSGSSVLCVAPRAGAPAVLQAMQAAFAAAGMASDARILSADNAGLEVSP
jgi:homoserine kinase